MKPKWPSCIGHFGVKGPTATLTADEAVQSVRGWGRSHCPGVEGGPADILSPLCTPSVSKSKFIRTINTHQRDNNYLKRPKPIFGNIYLMCSFLIRSMSHLQTRRGRGYDQYSRQPRVGNQICFDFILGSCRIFLLNEINIYVFSKLKWFFECAL